MGDRKNRNLNIPMCMACILLFLTLISVHMTSGLFARYVVADTGSDSARVAKFDIDCAVQPVKDEQGNNTEGEFALTITNHSEVAVKYSITVEFDAPLCVTIGEMTQTPPDGKNSVTFSDENWTLAPGADVAKHTLQFAVTDWTYITQNAEGTGASKELAFTVAVTAEQID